MYGRDGVAEGSGRVDVLGPCLGCSWIMSESVESMM